MRLLNTSLFCMLLGVLASSAAFAQQDSLFKAGDILVVTAPNTAIYTGPDESGRTKTVVQPGHRLKAVGTEINGFIPLATKSGKAFIHVVDIKVEAVTPVLEEAPAAAPAPRRYSTRPSVNDEKPESRFPFGIERITYDLGGSFGSTNGYSYSEIDLGANAYFTDWFAWREAVFGRFSQYYGTTIGLDSSVRGIYNLRAGEYGMTAFAGPGFRFTTGNPNAPFAEAGLVFHLAGISIGGGVKTILNSWVSSGAANDTQYLIIIGGGGSL